METQASLLERAARITRVRHPNLVRMLPRPGGAGFAPIFPADLPSTLATSSALLPLDQLVRYLMDVLAALGALHEHEEGGRGFVHGEVCPQHVFIIDGIARLLPVVRRHWVPTTKPVTSSYGAPELLLDEAPDHRADLFSVGAILWEAMTGTPPFADRSISGLRHQLELRPSELPNPATTPRDEPLGAIARRALSAPILRYQNAIELSNALGKALEQRVDSTPRHASFDDEDHAYLRRSVTPFTTVIAPGPLRSVETVAPVSGSDVRTSGDARGPARVLRSLPWAVAGVAATLIGVIGSSRLGASQSSSSTSACQSVEGLAMVPHPALAPSASPAPSANLASGSATCASATATPAPSSESRPPSRSASASKRLPALRKVNANDYGI